MSCSPSPISRRPLASSKHASGCRRWMAGDIATGARRTGSCRSDRATWSWSRSWMRGSPPGAVSGGGSATAQQTPVARSAGRCGPQDSMTLPGGSASRFAADRGSRRPARSCAGEAPGSTRRSPNRACRFSSNGAKACGCPARITLGRRRSPGSCSRARGPRHTGHRHRPAAAARSGAPRWAARRSLARGAGVTTVEGSGASLAAGEEAAPPHAVSVAARSTTARNEGRAVIPAMMHERRTARDAPNGP